MSDKTGTENRLSPREHNTLAADVQNKTNEDLLMEIEKILEQGENMDTALLEHYLDILQERDQVETDFNPEAMWNQLEDEHPLLFEESEKAVSSKHPEKQQVPNKHMGRRLFRFAEVAVAAMLILVVSANAFGVNPIESFINWAGDIIQVYSNPSGLMELPPDELCEFHSLAEALQSDGRETAGIPQWIPKDYSLYSVEVRHGDELSRYMALYRSDRGELLIRVTYYEDQSWMNEEEQTPSGQLFESNDRTFFISTNYDQAKAGWQIGQYSYTISGQLSEDELKTMLGSID